MKWNVVLKKLGEVLLQAQADACASEIFLIMREDDESLRYNGGHAKNNPKCHKLYFKG